MDASAALQTILGSLEGMLVSPYRELTLKDQHMLTGISPDILIRRWKYDQDWKDAVYVVGETKTDYRTTLHLINRCRERAAETARLVAAERSKKKKLSTKK